MADARLNDPLLLALLQNLDDLTFWQTATAGRSAPSAALERELAQDILAAQGQISPEELARYHTPMMARAASRLRAQETGGRQGPHDSAIEIEKITAPHRGFFTAEVIDFRHRRYDGTLTPKLQREVWVSTDVVTVLPYDPQSDCVLMVEQIRSGPIARGQGPAWLLETVAGRIDAGESPQEAALRETHEEAGLTVQELLPIGNFYPSPGAASEYAYNYIALCTLPESSALHGLEEEGEDIRTLTLPFDQAFEMIASGKIQTGPLIIGLLWLKSHRTALRKA